MAHTRNSNPSSRASNHPGKRHASTPDRPLSPDEKRLIIWCGSLSPDQRAVMQYWIEFHDNEALVAAMQVDYSFYERCLELGDLCGLR